MSFNFLTIKTLQPLSKTKRPKTWDALVAVCLILHCRNENGVTFQADCAALNAYFVVFGTH